MARIRVNVEQTEGPPYEAFVEARRAKSAIRNVLEQHPGPAVASVQGQPYIGRRFASGLITITTIPKEK